MGKHPHGWGHRPVVAWILSAGLALCSISGLAGPMDLGGQFAVSESGAATYSIPLQVPPGTAGLEPKLALTYNSQNGNGLLGMGWSLAGLSAITRCPQTMAQDGVRGSVNFDTNDRFCLDGQRLMLVSGTYGADGAEYRTERESFSKIVSHSTAGNGPKWFEVRTKGGQIIEYGYTDDSRIEAVKAAGSTATWPAGTVRVWAQNKLSDTSKNYLTVSYSEDNAIGEYYPTRIDYTGNSTTIPPYNSIRLVYEARPDTAKQYQKGSLITRTQRLMGIESYVGSVKVTAYQLTYGIAPETTQSRLLTVQEIDATGAKKPSTAITWQDSASIEATWGQVSPSRSNGDFKPSCAETLIGDVNGDGLVDLVCPYVADTSSTTTGGFIASNSIATSSSIGSALSSVRTYVQLNEGSSLSDWQLWGQTRSAAGTRTRQCLTLQLIDLNGDGYPDLVCPSSVTASSSTSGSSYTSSSTATGNIMTYVQWNQKAGFTGWQSLPGTITAKSPAPETCSTVVIADANGDGLPDLICHNSVGYTYVQFNQRTTFSAWQRTGTARGGLSSEGGCRILNAADVNGDGLADLVCPVGGYTSSGGTAASFTTGTNLSPAIMVQISQGAGFSASQTWSPVQERGSMELSNCKTLEVADVNGDGLDDLVCPYHFPHNVTSTYVQLGMGTGFSGWQVWSSYQPQGGFDIGDCGSVQVADINGDGRPDLICPRYDRYGTFVQLNQGNGFAGWIKWTLDGFNSSGCHTPKVTDINGDGKADLVCPGYPISKANATYARLSKGDAPDLVKSIDNGLGAITQITYKSLPNKAVYTKNTDASFPVQDIQPTYFVVSSAAVSNGIGGSLTTDYKYGGLKAEVGTGRGLLGFNWVESTQDETKITTRTTYRQDWPYVGLPSEVKTTLPSAADPEYRVSVMSASYSCSNPKDGTPCAIAAGNRYFPYASQSTDTRWELNGVKLPVVTTTSQYDLYGNPTVTTVSADDGYSKTITNEYRNDTSNWLIGRLLRSQVQSSTGDDASGTLLPSITILREPSPMVAGGAYTLTWSTTNATSVNYSCTASGTGYVGSGALAANGNTSGTASSAWVGYPSSCTYTATGPGGTKTVLEDLKTVAAPVAAPTLRVTRTPSPMVAGGAYTLTWNTTNATSVNYSCAASGTGYVGSGSLAANGNTSGTASSAWVGYPSSCVWTAIGPGGSVSKPETLTTK